ncbi:hypothetical protein [Pseudomonas monsensis]
MYIIDPRSMQTGDIVLTRNNTKQSKIIQGLTESGFSHVLLHVGYGSYMHADKNGTHSYNAQRLLLDSATDAIVLRLKDQSNIAPHQWSEICNSTRKNVGVRYAYKKALQAGINSIITKVKFTNAESSKLLYCSLLISEAYKCADVDLCPGVDLCTPGDIENSSLLYTIPSPVRLATESEIQFAKDKKKDKISHQTKATNFILEKSRRSISRQINTFDDLYQFALQKKGLDKKISKIIEDSGFLKMPELLLRDTPWRYEYNAFQQLKLNDPERRLRVLDELDLSHRQIRKYESAVKNYQDQYEKTNLICLKVQLNAFRKMLELSYKSSILFTNLLSEYNHKDVELDQS